MTFIDQIIDVCASNEIFSFMDGFLGYKYIQINAKDQHKTPFSYPYDTFTYRNIPFGLKNYRSTFHRAMHLSFHDIKHIDKPYLDDLPSQSCKRRDHPSNLQLVFE